MERLNKIPTRYKNRFYRDLGDSFDKFFDSNFQRKIISNAPSEDVKNYLLAISDFGKGIQDDINMYVMCGKSDNLNFRQKTDPIAKKISSENKIYLNLSLKIYRPLIHNIL